jgi:hypothetical protein
VNALGGNADAIEKGGFGHPIVAIGMISRHAAFIAEENIDQ